MGGRRWTVAYVNASRAHCVSQRPVIVTVPDRQHGTRTFTAQQRTTIDISPNSGVEALR